MKDAVKLSSDYARARGRFGMSESTVPAHSQRSAQYCGFVAVVVSFAWHGPDCAIPFKVYPPWGLQMREPA